jgi:putative restriction endonuclease
LGWSVDVPSSPERTTPASEIERGFVFDGERVRVVGPGMGIFKPKLLREGPLTVRATLRSGHSHRLLGHGGGLSYDFAPAARECDNQWLTRASTSRHPLIYLVQVASKSAGSEYAIFAPLWVNGVDTVARRFGLSLAPPSHAQVVERAIETPMRLHVETTWAEREVRVRLHQACSRRIELDAYRNPFALCRLRVLPLFDAARLIPDRDFGEASVDNGIGLCALHHRDCDRRAPRPSGSGPADAQARPGIGTGGTGTPLIAYSFGPRRSDSSASSQVTSLPV